VTRPRRWSAEAGFTLVELLVAITILGIIMGAIGAMIATAFRTTTTVNDELNASRGPKLVARYWPADVENAQQVQPGGGGCGGAAVVTFKILSVADPGGTEPQSAGGSDPDTTVSWAVVQNGSRSQLRRFVCGTSDTSTVVPDLDGTPTVEQSGTDPGRWIIKVSVPDRSQDSKQFEFEVGGTQQVTTTSTVPVP
jgi:prepilin-type N-terminal cleavage/methylation domain-containing protein